MCARIFMTLLKNAKKQQNAHHSIESMLLSQSPTVKAFYKGYIWKPYIFGNNLSMLHTPTGLPG